MTLPPSYQSSKDYISDCLRFLKSHKWLYNYHNTHILVKQIFNNFPEEWQKYFKYVHNNSLNFLFDYEVKEDCPTSFKEVLTTITKLKPTVIPFSEKCSPLFQHNSGLSRKKLHEIISLAPLINNICRQNNTNIIIDIGSGLGYLSNLLYDNYSYSVLGVECSSQYTSMAHRNQEKYYPNAKEHVKFTQHYIDENSVHTLRLLLETHFPNILEKVVCVSGLHACADLSITILDLFSKLEFVKCLVIMPCCYHRIQLDKIDGEREYFKNFPASRLFKDLFEEVEAESFITRPFLRLACQDSLKAFKNMTAEEHEQHSRNCMYRAVLQEVAELENCGVKRLKRKSGKTRHLDADKDFQAYLDNLKETHQLEYNDTNLQENLNTDDIKFREKMVEKWNEHKERCYLVEVLTGLQASIQGICENMVLLDRVEFLKEKGFHCTVQKVTDDAVSPRCYALVACKE